MSFIRVSVSVFVMFFALQVSAANEPTVTGVDFSRTYVPNGFDSNDNVEIVGAGMFANSCYRYADTKVDVNHADKTITLTPSAYMYSGYCLQVLMPFDHTVKLGVLKEGTYSIKESSGKEQLGNLTVRGSLKADADDYLYAPVTQAFFQSKDNSHFVQLTGEFPLSCMKLKEVLFDKQADVIVVQPIVVMDKTTPCTDGKFPFEISSDIGALKAGSYLLHVRSMNGKSVNNVISVN